ncbi:MAG: nicotinate phosphoribosyltransferase [Coriobacteriia bacterium]|nr:nicotinate phosphoribosyltransferase [Coriobacteriia bacterium]
MAQARFLLAKSEPRACFELTFRTNPFGGDFALCAGLEPALAFLRDWRFDEDDLSYLRTCTTVCGSPLFAESFLAHLATLYFTCEVRAVPEGTVVFAGEPLVQVIGPLTLCQMVETSLLNIINFSTLIATKAARCVLAARPARVLEFGMRRAQGPDGALMASRAAYIGGVDATSNVRAGKRYGIPVAGTHAHSWIMAFPDELDAFRTYVATSPHNAVLLVDTYDTLTGVGNAITVAHEMAARGEQLRGIRLDSGDLAQLSRRAREMLDAAGLPDVQIVASNALDEYAVTALKEQGAAIDAWGIGTAMVTGGDQAALDGVYKMTAIEEVDASGAVTWQPRAKISDDPAKRSKPGITKSARLVLVMTRGVVYDDLPTLEEIRTHAATQLANS